MMLSVYVPHRKVLFFLKVRKNIVDKLKETIRAAI